MKNNAALKHEREENEKLSTALNHEEQENEKLNAALRFALLENDNLIELTRSLREQADGLDGLRAILEIIADQTVSSIDQDDNSEKLLPIRL